MPKFNGTTGDDQIDGSAEPDDIHGDAGDDTLYGHDGDDTLYGDEGNDKLVGGKGDDTLTGGRGADLLSGGDDADILIANGGDTVHGGEGGTDFDTLRVEGVEQVTDLQADSNKNGYDGRIIFEDGTTLTFTGIEKLEIDGRNYDWPVVEQYIVEGSENDDVIDAKYEGDPDDDRIDNKDNARGTDEDYIEAYGGDDFVRSGAGDDTIFAGSGNDTVYAGDGDDIVYGEAGDDYLVGEVGSDTLSGGDDADRIFGGAGDTVHGGEGGRDNDTLYVKDVASVTGLTHDTNGNGYDGTINFVDGGTLTFTGIETLVIGKEVFEWPKIKDYIVEGSENGDVIDAKYEGDPDGDRIDAADNASKNDDDVIEAYGGSDRIYSGSGDDHIDAGTGDDYIEAGAGDDTIVGGAGADIIRGESGSDTLDYSDSDAGVTVNLTDQDTNVIKDRTTAAVGSGGHAEGDIIRGMDNIVGSDFDDTLQLADVSTGGLENTSARGGAGQDTLRGGDGANTLDGGDDADSIYAGSGDTVDGGSGGEDVDTLFVDNVASVTDIAIDSNENGYDGTVNFRDGTSLTFTEIERLVVDGKDFEWPRVQNYIVEGSERNDEINADYIDPNDADRVDNRDNRAGTDDDVIEAYGGDDIIYSGAGNDTVDAGSGADRVYGGEGDDAIDGGEGDDVMVGGGGDDTLTGGAGDDTLSGEDGADTLYGGAGRDVIHGDEGNDIIYGGADDDDLQGSAGDDTLEGGDGHDTVKGGSGSDTLTGGEGRDILGGDDDADNIYAGGGDTVFGGDGGEDVDTLFVDNVASITNLTVDSNKNGYDGTINFKDGSSLTFSEIENLVVDGKATEWPETLDYIVEGTAGNDVINGLYAGDPEGDMVDSNDNQLGNNDDVIEAYGGDDTVHAGDGADTVDAGSGADTVYGGAGADTIDGGTGSDTLHGGTGSDTIEGGDGDDTLYGNSGADILTGGSGADQIYGNEGADTIHGGSGDTVDGGSEGSTPKEPGVDDDTLVVNNVECVTDLVVDSNGNGYDGTVMFNDGTQLTFVEIENLIVDGEPFLWPDYIVEGTAGADVIDAAYDGDPEGDMIDNEDNQDCNNDDLVEAYGGDDTVHSGLGEDTVYAGAGADTVYAGAGDDTVYGEAGNDTLHGEAGQDEIHGGGGEDVLFGGAGGDHIYGDADNDQIDGGDGGDTLSGGDGDDVIEGGAGGDGIHGGAGQDLIFGGADLDKIDAGDGDDIVYGGTGDDYVGLGDGDDIGIGGEGDDSIVGGVGNDRIFGDEPDTVCINPGGTQGTGTGGAEITSFGGMPNDVLTLEMQFNAASMPTVGPVEGVDTDGDATTYEEPAAGAENTATLLSYSAGGTGNEFTIFAQSDVEMFNVPQPDPGGDTSTTTFPGYLVIEESGQQVVTSIPTATLLDGTDHSLSVVVDGTDVEIYIDGVLTATEALPTAADIAPGGTLQFGSSQSGEGGLVGEISDVRLWDDVRTPAEIAQFHNTDLEDESGDPALVSNWVPDPFTGGFTDDVGASDMAPFGNTEFKTTGNDGNDSLYGGTGDDLIVGAGGDDLIYGDDDNDTIYGGDGADDVYGGTGEDTIYVDETGSGPDTVDAGDDRDTIHADMGDTVSGGAGGDDYDTLNLLNSASPGGSLNVVYTSVDSNGNGYDGYVEYFDAGGNPEGTLQFYEIEKVIPCFTPGTMIETLRGPVPVERLTTRDFIRTRDHGFQQIQWVGAKQLTQFDLAQQPHLHPVRIRKGALGDGLPLQDMHVSPQHRMLTVSSEAALWFGEDEVLVAAKHLTVLDGVETIKAREVTYIHVMCAAHEVILADGTWTESFQPADQTLGSMDAETRQELLTLFPELAQNGSARTYDAARPTLRGFEVAVLFAPQPQTSGALVQAA